VQRVLRYLRVVSSSESFSTGSSLDLKGEVNLFVSAEVLSGVTSGSEGEICLDYGAVNASEVRLCGGGRPCGWWIFGGPENEVYLFF